MRFLPDSLLSLCQKEKKAKIFKNCCDHVKTLIWSQTNKLNRTRTSPFLAQKNLSRVSNFVLFGVKSNWVLTSARRGAYSPKQAPSAHSPKLACKPFSNGEMSQVWPPRLFTMERWVNIWRNSPPWHSVKKKLNLAEGEYQLNVTKWPKRRLLGLSFDTI